MKTKTCTKCGEEKALSEFTKSSANKSGIGSWCKGCSVINARKHSVIKYLKHKKANEFYYCNAEIYKTGEVAKILGITPHGLTNRIKTGTIIQPIKPILSNGAKGEMYWRKSTFHDWMKKKNRSDFFNKYKSLKTCQRCNKEMTVNNFYFHRGTHTLSSSCKQCHSTYSKKNRYKRDIKKANAYSKKRRSEGVEQEMTKKRIERLTDGYLRGRCCALTDVKLHTNQIPKEIIALKKIQMLIYREIKKQELTAKTKTCIDCYKDKLTTQTKEVD